MIYTSHFYLIKCFRNETNSFILFFTDEKGFLKKNFTLFIADFIHLS